jgi:hypothetical protein
MFEEASLAYAASAKHKDSNAVSKKDILCFASLGFVKLALKRVCDVKGIYMLSAAF